MSLRLLFSIVLSLLAACAAGMPTAKAQVAGPSKSVTRNSVSAAPVPPVPDPVAGQPMEFFRAHGEANACGLGCSEWIAAEGKIDNGTAGRLQRLLRRLHGVRPPLFFHSPGGRVKGALELGRLIRAEKMTVSVGDTIPLSCERGVAGDQSCEAQIRAGHEIEARLSHRTAMCNSACVYAVAGGSVRLIPPGVSLGIHDMRIDPTAAKTRHLSTEAIEFGKEITEARLRRYVRRMGIDEGLLTEAFATPASSIRRLSRDDAARFGLDRREFGETAWQFIEKPRPMIRKAFFARTDDSEHHYVNAVMDVFCATTPGPRATVVFARERLNSDMENIAGQPTASISINGQDIRLGRAISAKFYQRSGLVFFKTLEAISDDSTLALPGTEFGREPGPSGDITLAMAGFPAAYAKLQQPCAWAALEAQNFKRIASAPPGFLLPPAARASAPLVSNALSPGATRSAVDAALGTPTETVGTTALYRQVAPDGRTKVMAGYFDGSNRLQRLARYVLIDDRIFDEIDRMELSRGEEFLPVRRLLTPPSRGG